MTTPMVAPKPLMLKEYLELDHDDDDGHVLGGGGVVTVRSLLDAELRKKTAGRSAAVQDAATANGNALSKFSAVIEAVKRRCLQAARSELTAFSVLSRKRKKQRPEAEQKSATVEDATWANPIRWQPLRFVSPAAASPVLAYDPATASGEAKKEYSPSLSSSSQPSENEEEEEATIASTTATPSPATEFDGKVGPGPVLIVKEDEEEEEFYRSLDSIERTTEQLLHRIRRFEMLAELDHAAECCSRSSDGEYEEEEELEERAWELLGRLKANPPPRGGEKLLLDFFIQGGKAGGGGGVVVSLRQRPRQGATTTAEMLSSARRWIDGRRGEAEQHSGHGEAATLREMEEDGRWRCFHEEEEELGLQVGDEMLQSLVEELVKELA